MSVTVTELFESQTVNKDKAGKWTMTRIFHVGVHEPTRAIEYGPAIGESVLGTPMKCSSKNAKPLSKDLCELTCEYSTPDRNTENSKNRTVWSYKAAGESQHLVAVRDRAFQKTYTTTGANSEGLLQEAASKIGTAIGMQPDGTVDGCDIMIPRVSMSCEVMKARDEITESYRQAAYLVVGKVNGAEFHGWERGEVLLAGLSITEQSEELTRLSFEFLCSRNETGLTPLALDKTGAEQNAYDEDGNLPAKEGWQYLWKQIGRRTTRASATDKPVGKAGALSIHVATVYDYTDFSVLGIDDLPELFDGF